MQNSKAFLLSLLFLSACNGAASNPPSTGMVLPESTLPDGSVVLPGATATPAPSATPVATATPVPTATPFPVGDTSCGAHALTFQIVSATTRSVTGLTEGLFYERGILYESTGLISGHGASVINAIDPTSGKVTRLISTKNQNFGEGLVRVGAYLYQLTYKTGVIYQYTSDGTAAGTVLVKTFKSPLSQGWGLTTDGKYLLATNGGSYLYRISPTTLKIVSSVRVLDSTGKAISGMNELEYVNGQVYANIFPTNRMIRFDATSGCQTGVIDLSALQKKLNCPSKAIECDGDSVTNGVAYDAASGAFYLTGKSWPMIYQGVF